MAVNSEGTIITTRGLQLLTKLTASASNIKFTVVKVGTGSPPEGTDPSSLTHLVSYKMDGLIADYGYDKESMDGYVVMQIQNTHVDSGFVMTEIGLYAEDPDLGEILYSYVDLSNDPNHIMPADNGRSKTVQIKLHTIVGEVKEIHATINPLAQVTREVFDREITVLNKQIGDLTVPEYDDSGAVEGITNFNTFMDTLKSKMSIFDFFRNLKAGLKYVVHTGKIINDGLATEPGFVADARQLNPNLEGTLAARLAKLNSDLTVLGSITNKIGGSAEGDEIIDTLKSAWGGLNVTLFGTASINGMGTAYMVLYYKHPDGKHGWAIICSYVLERPIYIRLLSGLWRTPVYI